MLEELENNPPPPLLMLHTRLQALWPEYTLCHCPSEALSAGG